MRQLPLIKSILASFALSILLGTASMTAVAEQNPQPEDFSMDRVQLVTQQISLLKNRYEQAKRELTDLQQQHDKQISTLAIEKASKNLLDKAALDISVAKTNLDSINIELTDSEQSIGWLEKSIQEIENQINVLGVFGSKIAHDGAVNADQYNDDLSYQKNLYKLEQERVSYLQELHVAATNILQLTKEKYNRLDAMLKSHQMLHIKQQQVKDELAFQQLQNHWLQQLNVLYVELGKLDPSESKVAYTAIERNIYYANENAYYAYVESLIARYKDQVQQMKLVVFRSNSISLLNEMSDQVQVLSKQVNRLDAVLKERTGALDRHISDLTQKKNASQAVQAYIAQLTSMENKYKLADVSLLKLEESLLAFRQTLDKALQSELSARQGFPTFGLKMVMDLGKEMLLVPPLTFQIVKNMSAHFMSGVEATGALWWVLFAFIESAVIAAFFFLRRSLTIMLERPSVWREQLNLKWLGLQFTQRSLIDLVAIGNIVLCLFYFGVPLKSFILVVYLGCVWLTFKAIITLSQLCLVETTHDAAGHDVILYRRLRWIILAGAIITAMTVFASQLPLIFEIKILCDRLFLFFIMIVSLLLLRSWHVFPHLIISHLESPHPYLEKSIMLICILVPLLMLGNSVIGLFGFLNLVMTVSWYEGIFMLVLIGYLIIRGLLTDGMEILSRLMIQHVNNGWLWTEAFLKPLDAVLRITLFLSAWLVLFFSYGWDGQSPIVEQFVDLLHYQLASILNTTITPLSMIELFVAISVFYWTAKWTREFVYRLLLSRTKDMGVRNSIAVLSQYSVVILGAFICLRVLGINLQALAAVAAMFAFGIGLGLRDLANNFACGFLILLERPLRVGDIVSIDGVDGEVANIGSRAVTVRTWDRMELVVPNSDIFNKPLMNWTAKDNIVRTVFPIKIGRYDNPHQVKVIIHEVLAKHDDVLKDPAPEVYLKEMNDILMEFELRYFVNIRHVKSRVSVMSVVLMGIWDAFAEQGIKAPYPQQEIFLRGEMPALGLKEIP